ncbi:hypothetical protein SAMN04488134_10959 [Amphibacillus marinus]|uniref:Uncharacterized protein n=1 Tax=Amphibacillus marinus TaxID=872970 RepID=A0A1H8QWQ6_9BACI|nr:hypothetical protein [Amphibacillus marinus]SEO58133.1 hypothetical protein SAMN04488134_10959 [Amphibacillus marinus]
MGFMLAIIVGLALPLLLFYAGTYLLIRQFRKRRQVSMVLILANVAIVVHFWSLIVAGGWQALGVMVYVYLVVGTCWLSYAIKHKLYLKRR